MLKKLLLIPVFWINKGEKGFCRMPTGKVHGTLLFGG